MAMPFALILMIVPSFSRCVAASRIEPSRPGNPAAARAAPQAPAPASCVDQFEACVRNRARELLPRGRRTDLVEAACNHHGRVPDVLGEMRYIGSRNGAV